MNQELLDRILRSPRLPSLPTIALDVINLVQRQDVDIKQIANTIQYDPALTSKILKTVNSSFYGQAHSISTVSHALVVLGLNSVKTLALGFSLVGNLQDSGGEGFDHVAFWKRSLYAATAAKTFAKQVGLVQQEEAFLGGLMQDLGMLAMNQALGSKYTNLLRQTGNDHSKLSALERAEFKIDHCQVGGALAESWSLPPLLVAPMCFHEKPDKADDDVQDIVRCVALGNKVANVFLSASAGQALDDYYRTAKKWFGLSQAESEPLLKEAHKQTSEMGRLFELSTGEMDNSDEILAQANEALANITLQTQQQSNELQQRNRQLSDQANTDSLTGVANRRRFNEYIAQQYSAAAGGAGPLSILFLDTDKFKLFNDTYGHPTGDRVLMQLGSTLDNLVGDRGLVARYGGEEFAIILPQTDRRSAAQLAEQLRLAIAASTVQSDVGEELRITASIGVATYEGGFFANPEQLVRAADQGVYAAKSAGRNSVRIFVPRPQTADAA